MDTTIQIRTNIEIKKAAQKVFKNQGITMSSAFNQFLENVVSNKNFTRPVTLRDKITQELKSEKAYSTAQEMWDDVDNW